MDDFSDEFEEAWLGVLGDDNTVNEALGDDLLFLPKNGSPVRFQGVFSSTYKGDDMGLVVDIQGHNVQCYKSLIPTVKVHDRISYEGHSYKIISVEEDGTGWITLPLAKR